MGLYPNVCMHKERRKVLTTEAKAALIHKSSVNLSRDNPTFPCPLFVFGEKIRTKAVSCKQMTMVSPIHLLLFASRKVDLLPSGVVRLDNWINLDMPPAQAAMVCALRPALEDAVIRASEDPEAACSQEGDAEGGGGGLFDLLRELVNVDAPRHGMEPVSEVGPAQVFGAGGGAPGPQRRFPGPPSYYGGGGPPPPKRGMFRGGMYC